MSSKLQSRPIHSRCHWCSLQIHREIRDLQSKIQWRVFMTQGAAMVISHFQLYRLTSPSAEVSSTRVGILRSRMRFSQAPFTRYNLLSNRLKVVLCIQTFNRLSNPFDNRFDNQLDVCLHDATGCQTGCDNRLYNRFDNQLYVNGVSGCE